MSLHTASILQFRAWFHAEVVVSEDNLRTLLNHSRWVAAMVKRLHAESELADDKMEAVCKLMNRLRQYLEENMISSADIQNIVTKFIDKSGTANSFSTGHAKVSMEDFKALLIELLVHMYHEHFSAGYIEEK